MGMGMGMRGGERENDGFDIYADFNNAGPRYSSAFGSKNDGYHPLEPTSTKGEETPAATNQPELVTVPAMGPEWGRDELRGMTKRGKAEKKAEARSQKWKEWNRGQRGFCGGWFTRRTLIFIVFGLCVAIAIVIGVCIPRVPAFSFNSSSPLRNATGDWATENPLIFSRAPANFSFGAYADLQLDTNGNNIPITFKNIFATVYDLNTGMQVATGDSGKMTLPAKSFPDILLPLNFTYVATNDSDQTWANWYNGCKNKVTVADGQRPPVQFRLILDMDILGLTTRHKASTQVTDADCPVELPTNSV